MVIRMFTSLLTFAGEDPNGPPNNLMPYIAQVAVGKREFLTIFGNDYPTKDGTGVRDYIHVNQFVYNWGLILFTSKVLKMSKVMDLAEGHVSALSYVEQSDNTKPAEESGFGKLSIFNLGTGIGYSVLDMVEGMKVRTHIQ